ncbi:MAG TPA: RNA polymerase sigma factor [Planctomycetota bacterium]|jgi:RNA polymerase sigma-70 factor (ECF subfamily)|nr:RNA polymerase sigma factor [Planctomycetota bacterium]
MRTCAEEDLLTRIRAGDPASLEELYARTRDRLFTVLRRLGADPATAEDLVHEVYLRVWTHRERLPEIGSPLSYLCAMARNLWKNLCEHRGFLRRMLDRLAHRKRAPHAVAVPIEREDVDRALATLDADPREVFVLHRFGGLSYREIADAQGVSIKTVEARMNRAFNGLRTCLRSRLEIERTDS